MPNWKNDDWAYLLGVVHGDGHVSNRSIRISVGYKDMEYAEIIMGLWRGVGYKPRTCRPRSAFAIDINNIVLTEVFRKFKSDGKWSLPKDINISQWLAGIFDTDGTVSLTKNKRAVIIGLKRSGNLLYVKNGLEDIGIERVVIHNRISHFAGREYEIEELRLTSFKNILIFSDHVSLRHPRKAERLKETVKYIKKAMNVIPLWSKIADWLKGEGKTWEEIAQKFNLTKAQVDSALQNIKEKRKLEIIPPPKSLTKYLVKDQLS